MKTLVQRTAIVVAFFVLAVGSTALAQKGKPKMKTITIVNKCTFNIHEIYLSDVDADKWGEDLLGDHDILEPGDSLEVKIECGEWDAKLVAEDKSTCVVPAVEICSVDIWLVTADCGKEE